MTDYTTIVASFAVGVATALLLKGRIGRVVTVAKSVGASLHRDMKMVFVVRSDLELGRNAVASHCADTAVRCYKRALLEAPAELQRWKLQGQTKVALKVSGAEEMFQLSLNADAEGLVSETVLNNETPLVLGIGPGPVKLIDKVAGHLKLL